MPGESDVLRITIGQRSGDGYPLSMIGLGLLRGRNIATMALDPDSQEVRDCIACLVDDREIPDGLQQLGAFLFQHLFPDGLAELYRLGCPDGGGGLRIALEVQAAELHDLPWELLYDPEQSRWLSASPHTPLSRYVDALRGAPHPVVVDLPLRVLVCHIEPGTWGKASEDHADAVWGALESVARQGALHVRLMQIPAPRDLRSVIERFQPHLVHFLGQSAEMDHRWPPPLDRSWTSFYDFDLLDMLGKSPTLRGAVLSTGGSSGLAERLAHFGMAAIGMQHEFRPEAAACFCRAFYEALASGAPFDVAANAARFAVRLECGAGHRDWCLPTLYLPHGVADLLEIQGPGRDRSPHAVPSHEREPEAPPIVDENVQFTVYRPGRVRPMEWYPLLAFAHLADRPPDAPPTAPHPLQQVQEQAKQALGKLAESYQPIVQDSEQPVPREAELTFVPDVEGVEFNPPCRTFRWQETVHQEQFRLRASQRMNKKPARGHLSVFLGSIRLADVSLTIHVDDACKDGPDTAPLEADTLKRYRRIFPSYSHKDTAIVEQCERFADKMGLGDTYLRDAVALHSGEVWERRLEELIEEADAFQLFWSSRSMHSEFVQREWEYALALGRPGFVRPVHWEMPLPACPEKDLPPKALSRVHFQRIHPDWKEIERQALLESLDREHAPAHPDTCAAPGVPAAPATMAQLVNEIQAILRAGQADRGHLLRVAADYALACRSVNERARRCRELLRDGWLTKARQLAAEAASFLDDPAVLDFPRRQEWIELCERAHLDIRQCDLDLSLVRQVHETLWHARSLEPSEAPGRLGTAPREVRHEPPEPPAASREESTETCGVGPAGETTEASGVGPTLETAEPSGVAPAPARSGLRVGLIGSIMDRRGVLYCVVQPRTPSDRRRLLLRPTAVAAALLVFLLAVFVVTEYLRYQRFAEVMGAIEQEWSGFAASTDQESPRLEALLADAAQKARGAEEKARVQAWRRSYEAAKQRRQSDRREPPPPPGGFPH